MKVAILGTGYVGLVSGVCLAAKGHDICCLDLKPSIVDALNKGEPTIHEEGLGELLKQVVDAGNFRASTLSEACLDDTDTFLIAVGTPSVDGKIDLSQIEAAATYIAHQIKSSSRFISVIVKSTVLPTTTDTFVKQVIETVSGKTHGEFGLGMNPEFLREGQAIGDFMNPDRIVFGHEDDQTKAKLEDIYAPWDCDKLYVNSRTAELIKYTNNALLALQVSAVNEIANIAAATSGIDMMRVIEGITLDKRWCPMAEAGRIEPGITKYLVPGCGFGGSCFPKDVQALRSFAFSKNVMPRSLQATLDINDNQPNQVTTTIKHAMGSLKGKRCLVLGLAFKPDTDDVRESASLKIIRDLHHEGAIVSAHDPVAMPNALKLANDRFTPEPNWVPALGTHDVIIIATAWSEYASLPQHNDNLHQTFIFDARHMFDPTQFPNAEYCTIGYTKRRDDH